MVYQTIKNKIVTYGEVVMFSHTLFSLPFAIISMLWAANGFPELRTIVWILIALVSVRNAANSFNRLVDRKFDCKNPRLTHRHFPQGKIKVNEIRIFTVVNYGIFIFAAWMLNPLALMLSPIAILITSVYSYTKRFTWLCHVWLGFAVSLAPVGAWVAVTGELWNAVPFILGTISMLWIAGFDIIYATQDISFDREQKLHSIPAKFGLQNSLYISRLFHTTVVGLFFYLFLHLQLGYVYLAGVIISAILLAIEHVIIVPSNRQRMNVASYNINQVVSMTMLVFTIIDFFTEF